MAGNEKGFIPARHSPWIETAVRFYVRRIVKNDFAGAYCLNPPPKPIENAAMIVTPNHVSWWDGFWALEINRRFWKRKFHIMMLEGQLRNYPLFARAGAFSIDPSNPKNIFRSLRYLAQVSAEPGSLAVFFPQGKIVPDVDRVQLKLGLTKLPAEKPTFLYPYYACVHHFNRRKPTIFFHFGRPISFEKRYVKNPETLEKELNILRKKTAERLISGDFGELLFGSELIP
jgi:1-acyl-sn-glycerol-3-phosphate acyltransferase